MVGFKKKICFMSVSHPMYGAGGAEVQTYSYARAFALRGWDTYYLTHKKEIIRSDFDDTNINVIHYKDENIFKEIISIIKVLFQIKPDVVFYRYHKYHLGIFGLVKKLIKTKYIWSVMTDYACSKKAATLSARNKPQHKRALKRILFLIKDKLFVYGVNNASLIMVQNEYQKNILSLLYKTRIEKTYSSLEIPVLNNVRHNHILFISTMKYMKHPEIFCELSNMLDCKDYEFIMIGKNYTHEPDANKLNEAIRNSKVKYIGELTIPQVIQSLSKAKLLINTSDFEGLPNTFVQAWACGTPVVSLNIDPDNLLRNKYLGAFCNSSIAEMCNNVNRLMQDAEYWEEASRRCRAFAVENLDIKEQIMKLEEVIDGLL